MALGPRSTVTHPGASSCLPGSPLAPRTHTARSMGTLAPGHLAGPRLAARPPSAAGGSRLQQQSVLGAAVAGGRRGALNQKAAASPRRSARGGSARSAWEGPTVSPMSLATGGTPRYDVDPAAILYSQRMVFLGSQVDDVSADWVISQLLLLDAQDPTADITLLINSPGGSVTAGMGIYDAMKLCRADVSTVCFGLAASMGAFLLSAGTKGKRYCMPNARVMIHQPLGGAQGSAIDVGLQVREMMYHKVKLNKILSRATGQSEEKVEEDTDRDNFMSAWEAVEYGLVDAVLGGDRPGLIAPLGEVKEPPKTKVWDLWTVKVGKERRRLPGEQNLLESASS